MNWYFDWKGFKENFLSIPLNAWEIRKGNDEDTNLGWYFLAGFCVLLSLQIYIVTPIITLTYVKRR